MSRGQIIAKPLLMIISIFLLISLACQISNPFARPTPDSAATAPATIQPVQAEPAPPAVVEMQPPANSVLGTSDSVTFYFNQPMNTDSVEAALRIQPEIKGSFKWQNDDTLTFIPTSDLEPETELIFNIAETAQAKNGFTFPQAISFPYNTAGYFELTESLPKPGSEDNNPASAIVASFNLPMVPLPTETSSQPAAFTLQPYAEGNGEWINTSTYIFYPDPPLSGGSQYQVVLNKDLKSTHGTTISKDPKSQNDWSFRTAMPELISVEPDPNQPLQLDDPLFMKFNQSMDKNSVEEAFNFLDPQGESIPGQFEWNENTTHATFTPDELLKRRTMYTLSLSAAASGYSGTAIGEDVGSSFMTIPSLEISGTSPPPGETIKVYFGFASLTLNFNAPIGVGNIEDFISIRPAVDSLKMRLSSDRKAVYLSGYFQQNTTYVVTVSRAIKDKWGDTPAKALTVVMKTAEAEPSISIPLFMSGIQEVFFTPDDAAMPIQASNISGVNVTSSDITLSEFINLQQMPYENKKEYEPANATSRYVNLGLKNRPSTSVEVPLAASGRALSPGLYYFHLNTTEISRDTFQSSPVILGVVSNINMTIKRNVDQLLVWLVDVNTNTPIPNREIMVYDRWAVQINSGTTDENGLCTIQVPSSEDSLALYFLMTGTPGQADFGFGMPTWSSGVGGWSFGLSTDLIPHDPYTYLYSDRPIYRPGQTVNYRGILRNEDNGRYDAANIREVTVNILGEYDMATSSRSDIDTQVLEVSDYGTFSGSATLPEDASPGFYRIEIEDLPYASLDFQVASYRKPDFEINISFADDSLKYGEELIADIEANYYFGAPLSSTSVSWALYSNSKNFYIPGGYTSGKVDMSWLDYDWMYGFGDSLGDFILEGKGELNPQGKLQLTLTPEDLSELDTQLYQELTLEATISDESLQPVSSLGNISYFPEDYFIGIHAESWFGRAENEIGFTIQTVDKNGDPATEKSLEAVFQKVTWVESSTYSISYEGPSLTAEYTPISTASVITDTTGKARLVFIPSEPGTYQLDIRGNNAVSQKMVWVAGAGSANWPSLPNQQINLQADAETYQPGQQASILIPNPFGDNTLVLVSIERSEVMKTEVININEATYELKLDLTDEDAPNIFLSVTLLGKNEDGDPDFRMGYVEIPVTPSALALEVNLSSNADTFQPQDEVDFSVLVRDADGNPVQGEFSLSLVDKAVLALADPNAPEIMKGFYGAQPLRITTSLTYANYARRITLAPPGLGGGGGMGILPPTIREEFKDTAYWNGSIETDDNGRASIRVALPDNLTTWVANLRGLTMDTQVGEASNEVVTTKDLLVRPITPRFLIAGDHLELAAVVHNNTDTKLNVNVSLTGTGFDLDDPDKQEQRIQLSARGQELVSWWVSIQDIEAADLVFEADAGTLRDASRPVWGDLPIHSYSVPQTFATSGSVAGDEEKLEIISLPRSFTPTGGELKVELSPSLVSAIINGLDSLEAFPYDFTECVLSRLLPNLAAYQMAADLDIEAPDLIADLEKEINSSLSKVAKLQNKDGGWSWYPAMSSNTYTSSYALFALQLAKEIGWEVNEDILLKAQNYLINTLTTSEMISNNWQYDRLVFQHYVLNRSGVSNLNSWRLYEFREHLEPWSKALLALTLHADDPNDLRIGDILSQLETNSLRTATGAHWDTNTNTHQNISTPNFNTALVLYTLTQIDPQTPLITDSARYLAFNRQGRIGWQSSYEAAWVLLALSETVKSQADTRPSFAYHAELNSELITSGMVDSLMEAESVSVNVPVSDLFPNNPNSLKIKQIGDSGNLYYRTYLQVNQKADTAQPLNKGLSISRQYFKGGEDCREVNCEPVSSITLDDSSKTLVVRLSLSVPQDMYHVVIEDFIPSGTEVYDPSLKTSQQGDLGIEDIPYDVDDPFKDGWGWWYFSSPDIYDDHVSWMAYYLPVGTYQLTYRLVPFQTGEYQVIPAHAYQYYYPEVEGTSAGALFKIVR